jgi:preprotein translocase SecE subunit
MANKTIDRKKAVPARSQAAKTSPRNSNVKAPQPSGTTRAKPSDLKAEKVASEVLEAEDEDIEAVAVDQVHETDDEEGPEEEEDEEVEIEEDEEEEDEEVEIEEDEEEEEVIEEKPARNRFAKSRRERDVLAITPEDYSVSRPTNTLRFLNNPPGRFLRASYRELRLVTWPSRRDTWNWSVVVIAVCVGVAVLLGAADFGLSRFVTWWLSLAH